MDIASAKRRVKARMRREEEPSILKTAAKELSSSELACYRTKFIKGLECNARVMRKASLLYTA